jgi:hypothetical protein
VGVERRAPIFGVRIVSFDAGEGEEKSDGRGVGLDSIPKVLTSTLSFNLNVPSLRRASSKSMSVRDTRRISRVPFGVTGCKPVGKAEGSAGERGGFRKIEARVGGSMED